MDAVEMYKIAREMELGGQRRDSKGGNGSRFKHVLGGKETRHKEMSKGALPRQATRISTQENPAGLNDPSKENIIIKTNVLRARSSARAR